MRAFLDTLEEISLQVFFYLTVLISIAIILALF